MKLYKVKTQGGRVVWATKDEQGHMLGYEAWEQGREAEMYARLMAGEGLGQGVRIEGAVRELAPVMWRPSKVVCVGLNYRHHAEEMGKKIPEQPLFFMKPSTSIIGPGGAIELPAQSELVHHEGELAMIIGKEAKGVAAAGALDEYVVGYVCANDVTARDIQRAEGGRYTRAKGFDTFCALGPCMRVHERGEGAWGAQDVAVSCEVNGEVRQASRTSDMIFGLEEVVSFVSGVMTLLPGDVVLTGTPSGVGELVRGDRVRVRVEGIGVLENEVVERG